MTYITAMTTVACAHRPCQHVAQIPEIPLSHPLPVRLRAYKYDTVFQKDPTLLPLLLADKRIPA